MNAIQFVDYCMAYYGRGQMYDMGAKRAEVLEALAIRLTDPRWDNFPFAADSMDRELIRDLMLKRREGVEA